MSQPTLASRRRGELARFLAVGLMSTLANTAIIMLLTELLRIDYLVAYALCFVLVTLFGFAMNRRWSFAVERPEGRREVARYYLVTATATAFAMAVSRALVASGLPYGLAVFLSAGALAPVNFVAHRCFSFSLAWRR